MGERMNEQTFAGTTENVIQALQKVITLLDKIKGTIQESSGKIPKAAVQLNTVTQATEMATVEILNVLETLGCKIESIDSRLLDLRKQLPASHDAVADDIAVLLREVKDDTMNITMAMQVQDITAQKIAAANHLIESVRLELLHELDYFETTSSKNDQSESGTSTPNNGDSPASFDKDASFHKTQREQDNVDRVVSEWREKNFTKG